MKFEAENSKSAKKLECIRALKSGVSVSKVSRSLGVARETVYRWSREANQKLGARKKKEKKSLNKLNLFRIVECFIILGRPSMKVLSNTVSQVYGIHISDQRLRRIIETLGLKDWNPGPLFEFLIAERKKFSTSLVENGSLEVTPKRKKSSKFDEREAQI